MLQIWNLKRLSLYMHWVKSVEAACVYRGLLPAALLPRQGAHAAGPRGEGTQQTPMGIS